MINLKNFKPDLIDNNPKDGSWTKEKRNELIQKMGGISMYTANFKKDGCRLQLGLGWEILTRSLKTPQSLLVQERFTALNRICDELRITLDGEFYMHGLKFNEIFRFFSNTDVTRPEVREALWKELKKVGEEKFNEDYNNRSIDWLCTFHKDLKFWFFDGMVLDRPEVTSFDERMNIIHTRLNEYFGRNPLSEAMETIIYPSRLLFNSTIALDDYYEMAVRDGWEGLVLTHREHKYKFGRNRLKQGTIMKMKDDRQEWDGIVLDVEEASKSIEGTERTTNELGRSVTSKKKEDREESGLAKGFIVKFEGKGTITVGLRGFNNDQKRELLENKENYIGRHFKYSGMPPVKDFPRSVYFDCWRDEK